MKTTLPHRRKLFLFLLLNVVDLFLTWLLLSEVNGDMYESNPIADWWLRRHGWAGLTVFKSFIVFLAGSFFVLGCYYRPRFTGRCLTLSCVLLLAVVLYSCGLVPLGKMRAMEVQAHQLVAALPPEEAEPFRAAAEPLADQPREEFRSCYDKPLPRTGEPWLTREDEDSADDDDLLDPRP